MIIIGKNSSLYKCIIPEIMSKTYYYLLAFSLHFEEKANQGIENIDNKNPIVDPRHKIESYLEKLSINDQKFFVLGKKITIDESLLHFAGRNNTKYYIPMKPHKWGFKIHMLYGSDSKYLYNLYFDLGKFGKEFI